VPEPDLLYLTRAEVAALLPPLLEQVDLAERTYRAMAAGRVELPPKPGIHPRADSFLHAMPAYLADDDVAALKWVSGYPANRARGLPYISGLIVVNDAGTGVPEAVLDAAEITAARTAAASGACVRRWAPTGWRRAAILGYGEQGRRHDDVLRALNPDVEVATFDPRADVSTAEGPREAVKGAEVVVTAGPIVDAPEPPLTTDWLGERWLLQPIDFDFYVGPEPVTAADLFAVDDIPQFEYYRASGHFAGWPVPEVSTGEAFERDGERVVACNLGVGSLDAAFAASVLRRAREEGAGTRLPR
jgi:ornithine cyclodeaminase/alanine dehydrogenase-like protein (mu-crystallin family)